MGLEFKTYSVRQSDLDSLEVSCKGSFNRAFIDARADIKSFYEFLGLKFHDVDLHFEGSRVYITAENDKLEGLVYFTPKDENSFIIKIRKPHDDFLAYADIKKFLENSELFIQNN